ncbi:hypothetical protein LTR10_020769 [Elasticomyces elasticus]|uniref:G domain-containing protein n=1 Tax=Exophiala sideris TaxID=1016849 RepID=A0ABR0J6C5_9EURO|nr:hypothetical protein LTR10_020769 [Elasticomyces elasticus]KAK5028846.1 hypothetical protein LTS07_006226 [Exophiala sideris]KAK5035715.1 hypothetical protein LTR13_005845 [Exophiala sideris]KAK5057350.1 hypothetical protein LTR69_007390 [Exophiala sideris]KAK5181676.1 hypothetical protein LTR44_005875 [Eurotiomycetes sp. CCFEE 6388]
MPNSDERFYLVDTPGFDDSNRPDQEILRELSSWLTRTYSYDIRLSGIIYLHRIMDVRFGGAAMRNLSMFKKLCGDGNLSSVVLATTFWSQVDQDIGETREQQLKNTPSFWGSMVNRGSKIFRHDLAEASGAAIIQYLLDRHEKPVYAMIQDEMVNKNMTLEETAAGSEVQTEMDKLRRRYEKDIQDLKQEMERALNERDETAREELEKEKQKFEEFIEREREEREKMRANAEALWQQREAEREIERSEHMRRMEDLQRQYLEMEQKMKGVQKDAEQQKKVAELQQQIAVERAKLEAQYNARFSVRSTSTNMATTSKARQVPPEGRHRVTSAGELETVVGAVIVKPFQKVTETIELVNTGEEPPPV